MSKFQILPEIDAPSETWLETHPFVVQYSYNASPNRGVDDYRHEKARREIVLLLGAILKFGLSTQNNTRTWVLVPNDGESIVKGYQNKNLQLSYFPKRLDDFKKDSLGFFTPDGLPEISIDISSSYFTSLGKFPDEVMALPKEFREVVGGYFSLSASRRDAFLRASYWFCQSLSALNASHSLSYLCMVLSIEALMSSKKSAHKVCPEAHCNRLVKVGSGPTAEFRRFVDYYAQGVPDKTKRRFYDVRSSLAHGSGMLHSDRRNTSFEPASSDETSLSWFLGTVVSVCLVNWILMPPWK